MTLQANDPADDDAPLTVTATLADPTQGTLTQLPNGDWQFTSAPGVSGDVVVNYTVTDQDGASDSAIHTVKVGNQPPVLGDPDPTPGTPSVDPLNPNNLVIPAVDAVAFAPVDLDDYITDPNTGDTLTFTVNPADVPSWATYDDVTHILTGTPPADNTGSAVIPVTVNDGKGGTFIGSVTIIPVNPAPLAVDDTQATQALTATPLTLVANDSDPDGDPYTVTAATLADPTQGTLTLVGSDWVFTSAAGVTGPVVVNYTITDQDGATASAKHTVEVNGPPALTDPDPTPGTPSVDPLNPNNLVIPAVDAVAFAPVDLDDYITDPNTGDTLTYTVNPADVPTWAAFDPVTHILTGTPPADNTGSVVIPVTVNDGKGGTFIGSVTIVPVNPAPDAVDDTQAVAPGTATVLTLQANDPADDDAPLTVTATLADPTQGTLTQLRNGDWQFTSAPGVSGDVVVNYTVTDQDGASDSAIHTMEVATSRPCWAIPIQRPVRHRSIR